MILPIFLSLCGISLAFIFLGFYRLEHSEVSIVGFFFLFLLSMILITNGLEYKVGMIRQGNFSYVNQSGTQVLVNASVSETDQYIAFEDETGFLTTERLGYWMAIASAVGLIGAIVSIRRARREDDEE